MLTMQNPSYTQPLPPPHQVTQKGPLSPGKSCEVVQNNLWVLPMSLLVTAATNPVLARTRTNGGEKPLAMPSFQTTSEQGQVQLANVSSVH